MEEKIEELLSNLKKLDTIKTASIPLKEIDFYRIQSLDMTRPEARSIEDLLNCIIVNISSIRKFGKDKETIPAEYIAIVKSQIVGVLSAIISERKVNNGEELRTELAQIIMEIGKLFEKMATEEEKGKRIKGLFISGKTQECENFINEGSDAPEIKRKQIEFLRYVENNIERYHQSALKRMGVNKVPTSPFRNHYMVNLGNTDKIILTITRGSVQTIKQKGKGGRTGNTR